MVSPGLTVCLPLCGIVAGFMASSSSPMNVISGASRVANMSESSSAPFVGAACCTVGLVTAAAATVSGAVSVAG